MNGYVRVTNDYGDVAWWFDGEVVSNFIFARLERANIRMPIGVRYNTMYEISAKDERIPAIYDFNRKMYHLDRKLEYEFFKELCSEN